MGLLELKDKALQRKLLIGTFLFLFLSLCLRVLFSDSYAMTSTDEGIYIQSARLFAETQQTFANGVIAENISAIGGYNWYGPIWHIVYGFTLIVVGSEFGILTLNIFIALLLVALVWKLSTPKESSFLLLLLSSYSFLVYPFSYYPEILILGLSVVNVFFLRWVYLNPSKWPLFLIAIIFQIPIRLTFVFWVVGLIPLISKKNWHFLIPSSMGVLGLSFLFLKYFTAPAFARGVKVLAEAGEYGLFQWLYNTLYNAGSNVLTIFRSPNGFSILLVFGTLSLSYFAWINRSKLTIALTLIPIVTVATLTCFYTTLPVFFLKQFNVALPALLFGISIQAGSRLKQIIVLCFMVGGLVAVYNSNQSVSYHILSGEKLETSSIEVSQSIKSLPEVAGPLLVLLDYSTLGVKEFYGQILPVVNDRGIPIIYTSNVCEGNCSLEEKYELHNKLNVNYALSSNTEDLSAILGYIPFKKKENYTIYKLEK